MGCSHGVIFRSFFADYAGASQRNARGRRRNSYAPLKSFPNTHDRVWSPLSVYIVSFLGFVIEYGFSDQTEQLNSYDFQSYAHAKFVQFFSFPVTDFIQLPELSMITGPVPMMEGLVS
jgi:hypothetical protein